MKELHTGIDIEVPADRIWALLGNFESYSAWNPCVRSIRGELRPGAKLHVRLQLPGSKPMSITPTVMRADPGPRAALARLASDSRLVSR